MASAKAAYQPRRGQKLPTSEINIEGNRVVHFDFEATGLENCHITQIAALSEQGEEFSTYVLPKIPIGAQAQRITSITCNGQNMYHRGNPVPCLTITQALRSFIRFLGKKPTVLLGHNIKKFDCPVLLRALENCGLLEQFPPDVYRFLDTLTLSLEIAPRLRNYRLATLYRHYTGKRLEDAHDATGDVRATQQIVRMANPDHQTLLRHIFHLR